MATDGCVNEPGWSLEFWERDAYACCDAHALALACHHGFETFEHGARAWIEMFERDGHAAACSLSGGWRLVRLFDVRAFCVNICLLRSPLFGSNNYMPSHMHSR
jgi:hypothetical protein